MDGDLEVRPGVVVPATDLEWSATGASGPGGQHVNRTATKVELRFDLAGTRALPTDVKARLRRLAGNRLDAEGRIRIESQSTRSQLRNREDARHKLRELILAAWSRPPKRRPTKPSRSAKRRRLEEKRKHAAKKRRRGRVSPDDT
ncbi:MAG: alternative ribosome rescue aminoacyl-tRNA hydrolase ArfB [Myxococcota bacterium]